MQLIFVANNYPSLAHPSDGTFVQQFVWAMSRQSHDCFVLKPTSIFDMRYGRYPTFHNVEHAEKGNLIQIYRPKYISFSSKNLGWTHTGKWTNSQFRRAAFHAMKILPTPDLVYGHFLYPSGFTAKKIAETNACPAIVGVGESSFWTLKPYGDIKARRHYADSTYFLANSSLNRHRLTGRLGIESDRILVEPNGIDLNLMYPRSQSAMRMKYCIPEAPLTVAFVGANVERKGPQRLLAATRQLPDVQCVFAGTGTQHLDSTRIAMSGPCAHSVIPEILSSADVFVLPTTNEGSCNAVIEAMACGLPIITSNGAYMDDIVDDEVAIRVDPMDVGQIREAIIMLRDDPERRKRMSEACLQKAKQFDINERARRVTEWMEEIVRRHRS